MINSYLEALSETSRDGLYTGFGTAMIVVFLITLLFMAKEYRMTWKQAGIFVILYYASYVWANMLISKLFVITHGVVPAVNLGVSFGFFLLLMVGMILALRIPVFGIMDPVIPVFIAGRAIGIWGCIFAGCCHGYPASWGIYSCDAGGTVVPTVLIDSGCSLGIAIYLYLAAKKDNFSGNGKVSVAGLILFGLLRTAVDILRDNHKLIGILTLEGFFGMLYVLAGILIYHFCIKGRLQELYDTP